MKNNGYDTDECCYEEMTKSIGGQSQPSECWDEPMRNSYENSNKGNFDQSGMKKR